MRYLLISDVHGSYGAIKKVEEIILNNNFDKIISLGDILYHGPRNDLPSEYSPKKVIEIVKKYHDKFVFIQGNCDAEVDSMVLNCKFKKKYKIKINNRYVYFTHGHHLSKYEPDLSLDKESIVIYGHYHVFDISNINDVTYLNVGSTSIPKDNISQYAILDDEAVTVYNLDNNEVIGKYIL